MSIEPLSDSGREFTDEFGNVWRWSAGRATFVRGPGNAICSRCGHAVTGDEQAAPDGTRDCRECLCPDHTADQARKEDQCPTPAPPPN